MKKGLLARLLKEKLLEFGKVEKRKELMQVTVEGWLGKKKGWLPQTREYLLIPKDMLGPIVEQIEQQLAPLLNQAQEHAASGVPPVLAAYLKQMNFNDKDIKRLAWDPAWEQLPQDEQLTLLIRQLS